MWAGERSFPRSQEYTLYLKRERVTEYNAPPDDWSLPGGSVGKDTLTKYRYTFAGTLRLVG